MPACIADAPAAPPIPPESATDAPAAPPAPPDSATGAPAAVAHEDPGAATMETWTEWVIPLAAFADQGVNLGDVNKIAIGLGSESGSVATGGSGKMYFDDIRLYRP